MSTTSSCYLVVNGISRRYFPLPEIFNFQILTSRTFVAWNFSSSQMALKGLQKREWIERVLFLLKMKRSGGEVFLNINPVNFLRGVSLGFAKIVFFLLST